MHQSSYNLHKVHGGTPDKEKSVYGTRKNAKSDTRLNSKPCLKRNFVIADQGNKCILVFKKENELRQKSPTNLRAVSS